jgi:hypothetical protein
MRIRIPNRLAKYYDRTMDAIAIAIFPPPKKIGLRIAGYEITLTEIMLAIYTITIAVGLMIYFENWLWAAATILLMVFGAMAMAWVL